MSLQKSIENAKRSGILSLKCLKKENISTLKSSKLMLDEVHIIDLSCNKLSKIPNKCKSEFFNIQKLSSGRARTNIHHNHRYTYSTCT